MLLLLRGACLLAADPSATNTHAIVKPSVFSKGAGPIHPELFKKHLLWETIAKVDPPEKWNNVITPENRDKYPTTFSLVAHTNNSTATFHFTYAATNFNTGLRDLELFEPDLDTLNSPRAEDGLVSIMLQTSSTDTSNGIMHYASFTYPTNRVSNAYLRVRTFHRRLWPISLFEFMKKPDSHPVTDAKDVTIDISI